MFRLRVEKKAHARQGGYTFSTPSRDRETLLRAARAVTRGDRGTLARSRSTAERIGAMLRAGGPPPVAVRAPADGAEDEPETPHSKIAREKPDWSLMGFSELLVHVALFMLSGPTLILLQKYVLGVLDFEYPIFIVTLAAVTRWAVVLTLVHSGVIELGAHADLSFVEWTRGMLPVGILECISLAAGSTAYLHISVSFVQMLKAFQPVVLNVFIVGLGLEKFSWQLFVCIMVVTVGSVLAAIGEVNFTMTGVWLMLISELAESAKYVILHFYLRNERFTLWEGVYFTTPSSSFSLGVLCVLFERDVVKRENMAVFLENWKIFFALVVLAMITTVSGFGIIKELGSVSNKVLVMLRNALLIYPAVQLYDDIVTPIQIIGYGVTAVGTTAFAFIKVSQEVIVRTKSQMDLAALAAQEEAKESGIGQSLLRSLRTTPRGESSGGAGLRRTKPKK
jgi:hypothetical protein